MVDTPHLLIIEARFYDDIADELVRGAVAAIDAAGGTFDRIDVPGAFEIPAAVDFAIRSAGVGGQRPYDGYVALGCVIRGETTHYDYVCGESARGLQDLALRYVASIGYAILKVENRDQACALAAVDQGDKGGTVARAALRMIELKSHFGLSRLGLARP